MILEATHSKIDILSINRVNVTYNLTCDGSYYGIECYLEGARCDNPREYASVPRLTCDRSEAERYLKELIEKNVFPVHLKDVLEDEFGV